MAHAQSRVYNLLKDIAHADVEPSVYNVSLGACSHRTGFDATVTFRCSNINHISMHGGTPEEALERLFTELIDRFGPCPHCGRKGQKPA